MIEKPFECYLKTYEKSINKYAQELSREIGKPDESDDYYQEGAKSLFELYKKREELVNFEPEIYKYKDILKEAKRKRLITDFSVGVRNPYRDTPDLLTLATKWVRAVLKNDIKDYRKQSFSDDEKTILSNDIEFFCGWRNIDKKSNNTLEPNNIRYRTFKALNLYDFNILKTTEDDIANRIDIQDIVETIKNPNLRKIFILWCNFNNAYEISKKLGISNQAVYKQINKSKRILNLYYYEKEN